MIDALRKRFEFAQFCTIHRRSLAAIQGWQLKQLRRLIQHAFLHVPMWRDIFTKAKLKEGHLEDLSDLEKIPLTNKATYVGKMVEEYVDGSRDFIQEWDATSGSTGEPFRFLLGEHYMHIRLRGIDLLRIFFLEYIFLLWNGKRLEDIAKTKVAHIRRKKYFSPFKFGLNYADFRDDPKKVYMQIAEFKPEVLIAFSSVLLDIARMIEKDKTLPSLTPRYIVASGEMLTPSVRSFVSTKMKAEIYSSYGLSEVGVVGVECSAHDGFHINSESLIVQVTNDVGKVLPEGEHGRVIITDLFNYNMPFIRYDTGDRGSLSFSPCTCGLRGPRLWIEERRVACLTFGKRSIYRYEFFALYGLMYHILQYQVVKRGEQDMLLRVVPGPHWETSDMKKVEERAGLFLGNRIRVSIELVSTIPQTPSGKSILMVDESAGK